MVFYLGKVLILKCHFLKKKNLPVCQFLTPKSTDYV